MNRIAAVDCDGVLADLNTSFCEKFGWENQHLINLAERYLTEAEDIDLFIRSSRTYKELDILPLGVQIVKYLNKLGFDIHIVTARPEYCAQATGLWLKENKIPFRFMSVGVQNKVWQYTNLRPAFVLEDNLRVAEEVYRNGITTFLISQPWNLSDNSLGVHRIKDFAEFITKFG